MHNEFGSNAASADLGTNGRWVNPNRALLPGGRTSQDYTHDAKVVGTYTVSVWGGVGVSGVYRYASGQLWARGVNFDATIQGTGLCCGFLAVEPMGARSLPGTNNADLRVEKTFQISRDVVVGLYGGVFNVNNQGVAQRVNFQPGPNLGLPVAWSAPRTLRVGIRVHF